MGVEHLAVKLELDQRSYYVPVRRQYTGYRRNIYCLVCGNIISAWNCRPFRQDMRGGEVIEEKEKAGEESAKEEGSKKETAGEEEATQERRSILAPGWLPSI